MSVYYLFDKAADALCYLIFAFEERTVKAMGRATIERRTCLEIGVDEAGKLIFVIETSYKRTLPAREKQTSDYDIGRRDKPNSHIGRVSNVYIVAEAGSSSSAGYYQVIITVAGKRSEGGCLHIAERLLTAVGENLTDCFTGRLLYIPVKVDETPTCRLC